MLEIKRTPYLFEYFLKTLDLDCGIRTIMGDAKLIAWSAHISAVIAFLENGPPLRYNDGCEVGELKPRHVFIHADVVDD